MHQYMVKYHQSGVNDALVSLKTGYVYHTLPHCVYLVSLSIMGEIVNESLFLLAYNCLTLNTGRAYLKWNSYHTSNTAIILSIIRYCTVKEAQ